MNISPLDSAMMGIYRGMEGLRNKAAEVASADAFSPRSAMSVVQPLVEMKSYELQVKASASAVKIIDETVGSLIDELA